MNQDMIWQLIRYALLTIGGSTVTDGLSSQSTMVAAIGALITFSTWAWGCYVKWHTTSVPTGTLKPGVTLTTHPVTGETVVHQ